MVRRVALAALTLGAALVALASAWSAPRTAAADIVVTRDAIPLPDGCSPRLVGAFVSRFARAVSDGDRAELDRLIVAEDPPGRAVEPAGLAFRWYSVTEGGTRAAQPWRHEVFYDRTDLLDYFTSRHVRNERLELIEAEVRPGRGGGVGVIFRVRREADDLPAWLSEYAGGKAGIDCTASTPAIFLWSMAQNDVPWGATCPRPPRSVLGAPPVACSSGQNARALDAGFGVERTRIRLPAPCAPARVETVVRRLLSTFNQGLGADFARRFAASSQFHPYTGSVTGGGFRRRPAIARFVGNRYRAGDGWTATRLLVPQASAGLPSKAVFGVGLRVSYQGREAAARVGAKLVLDCRSGFVRAWIGPALKLPGR